MTRVLVVDDSQFFRTVVGNALSDADYDVETADTGTEAVEIVRDAAFDPDVVTMDVEMPDMNGIAAVERIMAATPTPVIMASAYTDTGAEATLDALEAGAIDFLQKPDGSGSRNIAHFVDDLREKIDRLDDVDVSSLAEVRPTSSETRSESTVRSASHSDASPRSRSHSPAARADRSSPSTVGTAGTTSRGETAVESIAPADLETDTDAQRTAAAVPERSDDPASAVSLDSADDGTRGPTIVVGASTGGPKIVERLLQRLPIGLDATVLIVQHMPADFTGRFADRLDAMGPYAVSEAGDGDRVGPGEAVVAPGSAHLEIGADFGDSLRVRLDEARRDYGIQPAIDVTMETAADRVDGPLCGVVLTGMGDDGAAGIEAIKAAGGRTIAQDEATSPVFGIPCQAIETGCVDSVAPAPEIVDEIIAAFADATPEPDPNPDPDAKAGDRDD
ncbi:chemotaxis-specific protein-glutamate methyltransferase CheB [Halopiger xanaduensis]|uniref:Protein-glutamate methylesterase/protein-glutamine glutaminase n=1 Tax=Halopiger xanaduensis (strain DSM 18323 / JCM 14033 / SH-6) TaxID=797210 RepID=F8DC59_HALXS|nr:chemotaxis-specific protein-glutamate methyltransferase CheB [Halopiger xanaduensis]AEH37172.1 response regulator receiver modulated CheB methylesterase [Halopiger xanaduensis SH-6]